MASDSAQLGDDVIDGVANGLEVFEVLILDAETDGAFADVLLEGLDEFDERERVGIEVVGEGITFVHGGGLDLEDVGETILDQGQHGGTVHGGLLDMGLCGHGCSSGRR